MEEIRECETVRFAPFSHTEKIQPTTQIKYAEKRYLFQCFNLADLLTLSLDIVALFGQV